MRAEFNRDIQFRDYRDQFQARKPVQIEQIFPENLAEKIYHTLDKEIGWFLAFRDSGGLVTLTEEQINRMPPHVIEQYFNKIHQNARENFQYIYSTYPIGEPVKGGPEINETLQKVYELLNSRETLQIFQDATGVSGLKRATCRATFYGPDHFITRHNDVDQHNVEDRKVNFIFSFTKGWRADWGGYLNFYDDEENIVHGFKPRFNVVTMSIVPAYHSVAYVAPFAGAPRYSIAGWFCGN